MWVIGLAGLAGSGKSTTAHHLIRHYGFCEASFAESLKQLVAREFGYDRSMLDDFDFKETPDLRWNGVTPREILQIIGTDAFRRIDPDFWCKRLFKQLDKIGRQGIERWVIPDVRFPNEVEYIRALGGEVWGIQKSGGRRTVSSDHESERHIPELIRSANKLLMAVSGDTETLLRQVTVFMLGSDSPISPAAGRA